MFDTSPSPSSKIQEAGLSCCVCVSTLLHSSWHTSCAVFSCSVMSNSLQPHGLQPAGLFCPWGSPDKNTRMGCHTLLQGIFPTQGLNPGLPYCRQILYHLSHQGSSRILECVAYPFYRGSSCPRN